jgi:predicted GNAT family acetyltransferase
VRRNKDKLKEVLYFVRENDDAKWCQQIQNLGVPVTLISDLPDEEITKRKAAYMDVGRIHVKKTPVPDSLKGLEKFHYKSNKLTISRGKIYPSKQDWLANRPIDSINAPFLEITPSKDFWPEMEYFFCADLTSSVKES